MSVKYSKGVTSKVKKERGADNRSIIIGEGRMFNIKEPVVNKVICNLKEHPNKKE